ncbi:MAG: FAD-dependent oxidoreductase [Pseudomonadota bacterium]
MPFEFGLAAPKKVAIIGGGVSGLSAAEHLSKDHHVTLFEAGNRLGGHARTVIAGKHANQPVDTGFIVYNYRNYPHLTAMFARLDVPVKKSDMSFGVSVKKGTLEYSLNTVNTMFGQRTNLCRVNFYRLLLDILKFNQKSGALVKGSEKTLRELLSELGTGDWHRDYYILPFAGAIWSTSLDKMLDFPADALMRFFKNHGLLSHKEHLQWYTVDGGSIEYVSRLEAALRAQDVTLHRGAQVSGVRRTELGVEVRLDRGDWQHFDDVVFACHSDQALGLMEDPSVDEKVLLGAIKYQPNQAVLHADPSVMPKRKRVWSAWNYVADETPLTEPVGVTYWMNKLQTIPESDPIFQSLNPNRPIREELIYDQKEFMHPVFDKAAMTAQTRIKALQGTRNTWFCGAYLRNGFHEDGYASGVEVADAFQKQAVWA